MDEVAFSRRRRQRIVLSVLTNRNFVPLWIGEGVRALGALIMRITLVKLVYDLTGSASGISLLILTHTLAHVIAPPISGVLADRFERKKLLISAGVLRVALMLLFGWASSPLVIYANLLVLTMLTVLCDATRSAIVPDVVEKEQLLDANALDLSLAMLMMISGPLLGGFIADRFSPRTTFILCATLYLPAALSLFFVRVPPRRVSPRRTTLRAIYEEFVEGVQYARVTPVVSALTIIFAAFLAGLSLQNSLGMILAEQVLSNASLSATKVYGTMVSVATAGSFTGTLFVRYLGRRYPKKQVLLASIAAVGLGPLGLAVVRSLILALIVELMSGIGNGILNSLWPTLLQENVEEDKRGRVFSLFTGVRSIPPAITVCLGGWLADRTSVQLVYGLAGGWVLLTAIGSRFLPGYQAISEETASALDHPRHKTPT
jgi:MFS family permease